MAESLRVERVAALVKSELGWILERSDLAEGEIVTINEVSLTPDLKQAHIYISVLGKNSAASNAGSGSDIASKLNRNRASLQKQLASRVVVKNTIKLYFKYDSSILRGDKVLEILANLPPAARDLD